jgi:hypothetical protein
MYNIDIFLLRLFSTAYTFAYIKQKETSFGVNLIGSHWDGAGGGMTHLIIQAEVDTCGGVVGAGLEVWGLVCADDIDYLCVFTIVTHARTTVTSQQECIS